MKSGQVVGVDRFYQLSLRNKTQIRLGGGYLYPLNHLSGSLIFYFDRMCARGGGGVHIQIPCLLYLDKCLLK